MKISKNIYSIPVNLGIALSLLSGALFTSCDDYLSIKPKKQEIPETLDDYVAFFNEDYMIYTPHYYYYGTAHELIGDYYNAYIKWYGETSIDYIAYFWTEGNRFENESRSSVYGYSARGVAVANQIIDGATKAKGCIESDRQSAIASARILRVMQLFSAANYFADAYDPATASTKMSIPLLTSSEAGATYTQPTIKELYDFMLEELENAVACPSLPGFGATIYIPGKGAGYAMLSRLKLYMRDYSGALDAAEKALAINDDIFDWVKHYNDNYEGYLKNFSPAKLIPSPMEHTFCENYYFGFGNSASKGGRTFMPGTAGEWFEEGDCYQKTNWVYDYYNNEYVYRAATTGFFNDGGLRTIEPYYIKAECLARLDRTAEACDVLNTIRRKYILPEVYKDINISSPDELIPVICKSKHAAMILSTVAFTDLKRLNCEGKYVFRPKKIIDGEERYLEPNHRLWTFPFAQDVMKDNTIHQNVEY